MLQRVRNFLRRRRLSGDIDDELRFHLDERTQENLASGMFPEEARRAARLSLGNPVTLQEETREVWTLPFLENLWQDVRYGLRQLRHNPGFAAVAILTLALGIAVNTTMFSAVSAVLLREPPVKDPHSLCAVTSKNLTEGANLLRVSPLDFESWQRQNDVFSGMAAAKTDLSFDLTSNGEPGPLTVDRVTPDYFKVIGIPPVLGRAFLPSEAEAGNDHVVILSHGLWRQQFASNPSVIGKTLELDHVPYTIIGVMPLGASIRMPWIAPRVWLPLVFSPADLRPSGRGNRDLTLVLGRLRPGATVSQAQVEMTSFAQRLAEAHPETNEAWGVTVLTLQEYLIEKPKLRTGLLALMCMVGLVLLIACANIAGLLLARGAARSHEMALRAAIGASRMRLVRQMLVESLLLGIAGGAGGLILSLWGIRLLRAGFSFNDSARQLALLVHLDPRTLLFTLVVSVLAAVVFGLLPALSASRTDPSDALAEGGRSRTSSRGRGRLRNAFVIGEIALALALSSGSGIVALEVGRELSQPTGFNPRHLLFAEVDLKAPRYKSPGAQTAFLERAIRRLREVPGMDSVGSSLDMPFEGSWGDPFRIVGGPRLPPSKMPRAQNFVVGPNYFRAMEIPLIRGRVFSGADDARAPAVAVISQEFARRFFPRGDAIGQKIQMGSDEARKDRIVGIVGNVLPYYGDFKPVAQIYECYLQVPNPDISFMLRSRLAPAAISPAIRQAIWSVDEELPVRITTMKESAAGSRGGDLLMAELMATFAALALLLAAIGVYGVIAQGVNQRQREIGIRVALGAQNEEVLALVLRQGGALTGIGCAIGLFLTLPLPRFFASLFGELSLRQNLTPVGIAVAAVAVSSLLATYIPARRAMRVDPVTALKYE